MSWLANGINGILLVIFAVVQLFSLVIVWIYIYEGTRVDKPVPYDNYKRNMKSLYWVSLLSLFALWFLIPENKIIVSIMALFALIWLATAIGFMIISIAVKNLAIKSNIRLAMMNTITNMIIIGIVAWIIQI